MVFHVNVFERRREEDEGKERERDEDKKDKAKEIGNVIKEGGNP